MYATIKSMKVELHEGIPTLKEMQAVVGGLIEPVDSFAAIVSTHEQVTAEVYANEESRLLDLSYTYHNQHGQPIFGDLVLAGLDLERGETVGLTKSELLHVINRMGFFILPEN